MKGREEFNKLVRGGSSQLADKAKLEECERQMWLKKAKPPEPDDLRRTWLTQHLLRRSLAGINPCGVQVVDRVGYLPSAFNSSSVLPPCLRRKFVETSFKLISRGVCEYLFLMFIFAPDLNNCSSIFSSPLRAAK